MIKTKEEALKNCTVEGNIIHPPSEQLDRKVYVDLKKSLEQIGGKWKGGKVFGFVFESDPSLLLEQLQSGEVVNLKKEFQFFASPISLCRDLVLFADIQDHVKTILEPSAGRGAIIQAVLEREFTGDISAVELMEDNCNYLEKVYPEVSLHRGDFLEFSPNIKFDRIIANPPFTKNQDIDHVYKMYDLLADGGRLVSVMSNHWRMYSSFKKEREFKNWIEEHDASIQEIDAGTFKESGTSISACFIVVDKDQ